MVQLEPLLCVVTDPMKSVTKLGGLACFKGVATAFVSAERGGLLLAQEAWLDGTACSMAQEAWLGRTACS